MRPQAAHNPGIRSQRVFRTSYHPSNMFLEENKLFPSIRRLENLETIIGIKNHYALYAL